MKKSLLIILIGIMCITLMGCGSKKKEENKKEENVVVDESLFKIKDKEFHLDTDKEFEGLKYKTSKDFKEINNVSSI